LSLTDFYDVKVVTEF